MGAMPVADRTIAKSRESKGAESADPKEVLCSNTCRITKLESLAWHVFQSVLQNLACIFCHCWVPDPLLHKLTVEPTMASLMLAR